MSNHPAHIKELIWLASYYERHGQPENATLILESIEKTKDQTDEWAAVRFIEEKLFCQSLDRKSA